MAMSSATINLAHFLQPSKTTQTSLSSSQALKHPQKLAVYSGTPNMMLFDHYLEKQLNCQLKKQTQKSPTYLLTIPFPRYKH